MRPWSWSLTKWSCHTRIASANCDSLTQTSEDFMRLATIDLLKAAYGRYAIGAFNVCNLEQIHGLFRGAAAARAPVIVQFTRVMRNYAHPLMLENLLRAAEEIYPEVIFAVHHDHGDEASCADAIASGHYSSVMIDASHLPFEQNVAVTRGVVEKA